MSTGGRLLSGGMLIGYLEGKGKGYDLRLPFSVMFPGAVTTASAPAPVVAQTPAPVHRRARRSHRTASPARAPTRVKR